MNVEYKGRRPRKKLSERRSYSVHLKLNTKEHLTLKTKANEAGLNRSEFLRRLIMDARIKARVTPEQMSEIRRLTGMANNINQIARRLHTYGVSTMPSELKLLKLLVSDHLNDLKG